MRDKRTPSNPDFNGASRGADKGSTAALVIDIQFFHGMRAEDAQAYADHLGQTLTALRQKNVPVIWAAIDSEKGNKPLLPFPGAPATTRDLDELKEMGFCGFEKDDSARGFSNHEIFEKFLRAYGPQKNEAVFRKSFMSALTEPADIEHADRAAHQKALLVQAGIIFAGETIDNQENFREIKPRHADAEFYKLFKDETTVSDYLREKKINNTIIMGQVGKYCVLETAISAAAKGFNPAIVTDRCLSWVPDNPHGNCVWQSTKDLQGNNLPEKADHPAIIQQRLAEIIARETREHGLTANSIEAVRNIRMVNAANIVGNSPTRDPSFVAAMPFTAKSL